MSKLPLPSWKEIRANIDKDIERGKAIEKVVLNPHIMFKLVEELQSQAGDLFVKGEGNEYRIDGILFESGRYCAIMETHYEKDYG